MHLLEGLRLSLKEFRSHRLRTSLTLLGIIFGVGAVIAMLSIGEGARRESLAVIRLMGINNIYVNAKGYSRRKLKEIRKKSAGLSMRDVRALEQVLAGTGEVSPVARPQGRQVIGNQRQVEARVLGVAPEYFDIRRFQLYRGRFLDAFDQEHFSQTCVLGWDVRSDLFPEGNPVGQRVKIQDLWFTVVGVIRYKLTPKQDALKGARIRDLNREIYIPVSTALQKADFDTDDSELDGLVVRLRDTEQSRGAAGLITATLKRLHRGVEDFRVVVPEALLEQSRKTQRIFNIVMGSIASISLLVGGIGIMNIMLATVLERTREIGVRRAVGARQEDILRQFLTEAVIICLVGGLLGIGFGFGCSFYIAHFAEWKTAVSLWSLVLSITVSAGVGLVFGIYPALRAARLDPIRALNRE